MLLPRNASVLLLLGVPLLAGCLSDQVVTVAGGEGTTGTQVLEVYEYRWDGDSSPEDAATVGWAMRLTNPTQDVVALTVATEARRHGPVGIGGWDAADGAGPPVARNVAPGQHVLWLFETLGSGDGKVVSTTLTYEVGGIEVGRTVLERGFGVSTGRDVEPGMHVQTVTVGLWVNGTSFYTNIAQLNDDPAFPAGYDRSSFSGDALPVYVYDQEASEQPARSKDTCHFTTIPGYNDLLKGQHEYGTGVRFLAPEEAYTRAGNEDHFLYGHALVFVNTVVAIEGTTSTEDQVPDPTAPCFDAEGYVPPVPPVAAA